MGLHFASSLDSVFKLKVRQALSSHILLLNAFLSSTTAFSSCCAGRSRLSCLVSRFLGHANNHLDQYITITITITWR
jgi:hypothetical protein